MLSHSDSHWVCVVLPLLFASTLSFEPPFPRHAPESPLLSSTVAYLVVSMGAASALPYGSSAWVRSQRNTPDAEAAQQQRIPFPTRPTQRQRSSNGSLPQIKILPTPFVRNSSGRQTATYAGTTAQGAHRAANATTKAMARNERALQASQPGGMGLAPSGSLSRSSLRLLSYVRQVGI